MCGRTKASAATGVILVLIAREAVRTRSAARTGAGVAAGRRAAIPRRV